MNCRDAERALDQLLLGALDAPAHAVLREHVRGCAACTLRYERITAVQLRLEGPEAGLPPSRMALLEQQLLARVTGAPSATRAPRWWQRSSLWALSGTALAAGVALLVLVPPSAPQAPGREELADGYQARGVGDPSFGMRAFCVASGPQAKVLGEAQPGGTLSCPAGASLQLTYTTPREVRLRIEVPATGDGEVLTFFPTEGGPAQVAAAVDQPLPFSTPVTAGWLSAPVELEARFEDPQTGALLGRTRLTLKP
jgi:hypothetical protein